MDRQPVLVAVEGPLKGARYPVDVDGLSLGRDEMCEVVIADTNVSRLHARLVLHNAAIWVQDAGSRNGVFVNEQRVVRHRQFGPGDSMVIGDHSFTLELEEVEDPDTTVDIVRPRPPFRRQPRNWIAAVFISVVVVGIACWVLA
jgi:pSer/pThr/pTyr-binding forkhead associated (FHA) protein